MIYSSPQEIAKANVPVLFPDTCILLDLLRSPRRDTVDGSSMLAGKAIRDAVHTDGSVGCIAVEQVRLEFAENLPNVRGDTERALKKLKDELKRIDGWSEALGHPSQTDVSHFAGRVAVAETLASDILASSLTHTTTPDITHRALARVMQKRTPAKTGKDSTKDCVVVESYLEVAQHLRNHGFTADIIFASSNTSEFVSGSPRTLNADISAEFQAMGILYSRSLNETRHLLGLST